MNDRNADFYLASASPRRHDLLLQLGYRFAVLPVAIDERAQAGESGEAFVCRTAIRKAMAGWRVVETGIALPVLGADTAVVVDGQILGKPEDAADAARMLGLLSGRTHRVLTAVAVTAGAPPQTVLSETGVQFRSIETPEIRSYWATGEPCDKAGAYAIQGLAAAFVARIEGSYSGVVGLPLFETDNLLRAFGVQGWQGGRVVR
ncbi:MAG: septum formation inhibitor Maf [Gammaproteobacteria bacterium]|nr:septum formation inhibitor Maf [Gammaproteobacteria bacterium]